MIIRLARILMVTLAASSVQAGEVMRMAVTTSFHHSGLSDVLLPAIQRDLDLEVQLLVVGTGQALKLGRAGDVDAVLVHSKAAEEAFVAAGFATHRREVMFNDFVLLGPSSDPAGVSTALTAVDALQRIAGQNATFVSRGDESGTHKSELALWDIGRMPTEEFGAWYVSIGAGMGAALSMASAMGAYVLSDRASWLNFGNKGDLKMLFHGDPALANQYAYLPVNPAMHPHVKSDLATAIENWMTSPRAQSLIDGYQIDGVNLFTFNAITK